MHKLSHELVDDCVYEDLYSRVGDSAGCDPLDYRSIVAELKEGKQYTLDSNDCTASGVP